MRKCLLCAAELRGVLQSSGATAASADYAAAALHPWALQPCAQGICRIKTGVGVVVVVEVVPQELPAGRV